ncbi:unnamed protein product [Lactuca saligna]|uniref:Uncharacterized protein n=1 Tax=Lactuca saligna TaxID=75948 RepID=A0AA35ZVG2_LACSI|nr:unnamed protein product [Lactuca saligna]
MSLYSPLEVKVEIPIALFEAGLHLPTTNFFNLIISEYGFSVRELTPIAINNIVGLELLYRAPRRQPIFPTFKHFFNASTQSGTQTLSRQWGVLTLIHDQKFKKSWQEKFLWVNNDLVVLGYPRVKVYVDSAPTLFGADREIADDLEKISINSEDWLFGYRKNALNSGFWLTVVVFALFPDGEETISLESALHGLFEGEIQCHEFDLVESFPHPVSG